MEIKITMAWFGRLTKYKKVLDKYNAIYSEDGTCATIKVDMTDLFNLPKELGRDLIIGKDGDVAILK